MNKLIVITLVLLSTPTIICGASKIAKKLTNTYETSNDYQVCLLPYIDDIRDCLLIYKNKYTINSEGLVLTPICDILYAPNKFGEIIKHEKQSLALINCNTKQISVQLSNDDKWTPWSNDNKLAYTKSIINKLCNIINNPSQ